MEHTNHRTVGNANPDHSKTQAVTALNLLEIAESLTVYGRLRSFVEARNRSMPRNPINLEDYISKAVEKQLNRDETSMMDRDPLTNMEQAVTKVIGHMISLSCMFQYAVSQGLDVPGFQCGDTAASGIRFTTDALTKELEDLYSQVHRYAVGLPFTSEK